MVTKTAREIIHNAMTLSNADNSQFADFELVTNLLNTNYKYIYNEIIHNSLAFTDEFEADGNGTDLPENCYDVIAVYANDTPLVQSSQISHNDGGWYVQNGKIYIPHGGKGYRVVYTTVPDTITAPPEWVEIENPNVPDNNPYFYSRTLDGNVVLVENNSDFMGMTVETDGTNFYLDGEDYTEHLERDEAEIINIQYHSPYIAVSYSDGKVFIFTGLYHKAEWNYRCIEGHETSGIAVAMSTNDLTGFGIIFYDNTNGKYYEAPFVPDTVLSYPDNTFFAYLEYRLAYQIAGMLGMEVAGFLQEMMQESEEQFYKNISQGSSGMLLTNMRKKGVVYVV